MHASVYFWKTLHRVAPAPHISKTLMKQTSAQHAATGRGRSTNVCL